MKSGWIFHSYVKLPEGMWNHVIIIEDKREREIYIYP